MPSENMPASLEAAPKACWDFLGRSYSVSLEGNSATEGSMLQGSPTFSFRKRTTLAPRCRPACLSTSEKRGFLMMYPPRGPELYLNLQLARLRRYGLGCWALSS